MSHIMHIDHIKVGRRSNENEQLPNNWELLDANNLDFSHGKIICIFGGNATNRPEAANGNAKIIKSLIADDKQEKTKIYSFGYITEPMKSNRYPSKEYVEETLALYKKVFEPLLYDDKGYMKEMQGIEHLFNKLVFSAHCGGSSFVNMIINEFYNTLTLKYSPKTAELLISKIKYFSYAPNELIDHNVTSLNIAPYQDNMFSFIKPLDLAESCKVDIDYPKGVVKRLLKAKQKGEYKKAFEKEFENTRIIMFKVGNRTYLIPNQLNPMSNIGDHSIECFAKQQFLNSGLDCENNAILVNYAARIYINEFLNGGLVDTKRLFSVVSSKVESVPVQSGKTL